MASYYIDRIANSRTPHGVRGLKSNRLLWKNWERFVAPRMGCVD